MAVMQWLREVGGGGSVGLEWTLFCIHIVYSWVILAFYTHWDSHIQHNTPSHCVLWTMYCGKILSIPAVRLLHRFRQPSASSTRTTPLNLWAAVIYSTKLIHSHIRQQVDTERRTGRDTEQDDGGKDRRDGRKAKDWMWVSRSAYCTILSVFKFKLIISIYRPSPWKIARWKCAVQNSQLRSGKLTVPSFSVHNTWP